MLTCMHAWHIRVFRHISNVCCTRTCIGDAQGCPRAHQQGLYTDARVRTCGRVHVDAHLDVGVHVRVPVRVRVNA